jgi:toxin ParE1/3/4
MVFCIFTENAKNDLENISDYIALDNPRRAISFIQEIRDRCMRIVDTPLGYPLLPNRMPPTRKVAFKNYVIIYTTDAQKNIVILHIHHAAQKNWDV